MSGISKHYMYYNGSNRYFDKRAAEQLIIELRGQPIRGLSSRLNSIPQSLSWRKKLLAHWALAKESGFATLFGGTLIEFRVHKGTGWKSNTKNLFKQYATMYRKFKVFPDKKIPIPARSSRTVRFVSPNSWMGPTISDYVVFTPNVPATSAPEETNDQVLLDIQPQSLDNSLENRPNIRTPRPIPFPVQF